MKSQPNAIQRPSGNEVHVWHLNLAVTPVDQEALWNTLDPSERNRCSKFRSELHKQRFIATQGTLRTLMSRYLGLPPHTLRFERSEHGKPRLAGTEPDQGLVFNVSHSGDRALFAVGSDMALGVDIEVRRPLAHVDGLVERCFAPSERDRWQALPPSRQLAAFFDVWTCKEAFIKAVGRGLGLGLTRCILSPDEIPRWEEIPESCGPPDDWSLRKLNLGEDVSAALCARAPDIHWQLNDVDRFLR
ncbi:4'-phosphopantetheinyl transferase family protein [Methylocaldum szegediense]|uniref:4'-phosphopantetheinyl transferase n=1 Tax=Methylocaldum szegediense TaxID=73780 RepID=A0ABM9I734_9GAMM|nr:4'-phosphopantetheinyl transferase superfamily protein [Methylocaldum szegediense]CAI8932777.1 4'-phosphopantetheinyl transferase [Methylocaldum szegediense]